MKKSLLLLIIAVSMCLVFSRELVVAEPHGKPTMTKADVVALANAEALRQGFDLAGYETPKAEYEFTTNDQSWTVFYAGKKKAPGNHFAVIVNDRTGKCLLMRGE